MANDPSHIDVLRINVDSTCERLSLSPAATPAALESWQQALGGYFEPVYGEGWVALIDDEGAMKGLDINIAATVALRRFGWPGEVVGPMLISGHDGGPDFSSLDAEQLEMFEGIAERVRVSLPQQS